MIQIELERRKVMQLGLSGLAIAGSGGLVLAEGTGPEAAVGPAVRPMLSDNPMWEAFGGRALVRIVYGGADFGECRAAVAAVGDGGADDWHRAWVATADRIAAIGDESAAGPRGQRAGGVSPRRNLLPLLLFPLYGAPVDPRLVAAFDKETAAFHKGAALSDPADRGVEIPSRARPCRPISSPSTTPANRGRPSSTPTATTPPSRRCTSPMPRRRSAAATTASSSTVRGRAAS